MKFRAPNRLADYFVVCGHGQDFTLVDPRQGRRESDATKWIFKPTMIDRFPFEDYKDTPLPPQVSIFCLPGGVTVREHANMPSFFTFVLTGGDGARLYGCTLLFDEMMTPEMRAKFEQSVHEITGISALAAQGAGSSEDDESRNLIDSLSDAGPPASASPSSAKKASASGSIRSNHALSSPAAASAATPAVNRRKSSVRKPRSIVSRSEGDEEEAEEEEEDEGPDDKSEGEKNQKLNPIVGNASDNDGGCDAVVSGDEKEESSAQRNKLELGDIALDTDAIPLSPAPSSSSAISPVDSELQSLMSSPAPSHPAVSKLRSGKTPGKSGRKGQKPPRSDRKPIRIKPLPKDLFVSKCICILSHWPLFSCFKNFLTELYRVSISPSPVPLERYISNFMCEVPLPPPGRVTVQFFIGERSFNVTRPPINAFPLADVNFEHLFQCLDLNNVLTLFECVLMEKKILLFSSHYALLGSVAEAVCSLIYPFYWQHVFIPLLPQFFVDFLSAPVPLLMGTHSTFIKPSQCPSDVVRVDLDNNSIFIPEELPKLPDKPREKLMRRLQTLIGPFIAQNPVLFGIDNAFAIAPPPESIDDEMLSGSGRSAHVFNTDDVRHTFFRFFVSTLKKYRQFIRVERDSNFRTEDFLRNASESERPFLRALMETQTFVRFIEDRVSPSATDYDIIFFDESIQAKLNRSRFKLTKKDTPFLNDKSTAITKTYVGPTPDTNAIPPGTRFTYPIFPSINRELLRPPREVRPLVEDEPDEQQSGLLMSSWKIILNTLTSLSTKQGTGAKSRSAGSRITDMFAVGPRPQGPNHLPLPSSRRSTLTASSGPSTPHTLGGLNSSLLKSSQKSFAALDGASQSSKASDGDIPALHNLSSLAVSRHQRTRSSDSVIGDTHTEGSSDGGFAGFDLDFSFEDVFANFIFDTRERCPNPPCQHELQDEEIRNGWSNDANDYRTTCPRCSTKFVPRFSIRPKDGYVFTNSSNSNAVSQSLPASSSSMSAPAVSMSAATPSPRSPFSPPSAALSSHVMSQPSSTFPPQQAVSTPFIPSVLRIGANMPAAFPSSASVSSFSSSSSFASALSSPANSTPAASDRDFPASSIFTPRLRSPSMSANLVSPSSSSRFTFNSQDLSQMRFEYLSPLLLRKEVENLLKKDVVADEKLFLEHPTCFWNLILHTRLLKIPLNFLLPQVDWYFIVSSISDRQPSADVEAEFEAATAQLESFADFSEIGDGGESDDEHDDDGDLLSESNLKLPRAQSRMSSSSSSSSSSRRSIIAPVVGVVGHDAITISVEDDDVNSDESNPDHAR